MSAKFTYRMKNMFKSKEEREIEARMQFSRNRRAFQRYYSELNESIGRFSRMARDAENGKNHANAVSCAAFVKKLQHTQVKVQGLLQRFEMMYSMRQLAGVMTGFMDACAAMGFEMDAGIDLKSMWKNTATLDKALGKLDAMSDQMDQVFETIDNGMNNGMAVRTREEVNAEAEELLVTIMEQENDAYVPPVRMPAVAARSVQSETDRTIIRAKY